MKVFSFKNTDFACEVSLYPLKFINFFLLVWIPYQAAIIQFTMYEGVEHLHHWLCISRFECSQQKKTAFILLESTRSSMCSENETSLLVSTPRFFIVLFSLIISPDFVLYIPLPTFFTSPWLSCSNLPSLNCMRLSSAHLYIVLRSCCSSSVSSCVFILALTFLVEKINI